MNTMLEWLRGKKTYGIVLISLLYLAGAGLEWWGFSFAVLGSFGVLGLLTLRAGLKDEIKSLLDRLPMWLVLAQVTWVLGLGLWVAGCSTLQPGADPLVVRAEQVQSSAAATFDLVLRANDANRPFWRERAPGFHEFCEWLRTPILYASPEYGPTNVQRVLVMQLQVDDLKGDYKSAKSLTRSNALWTAILTLESAVGKAAAWQTLTE